MERRALRVHGVVQGVGFRPFVHRLAASLGVAGVVGNDAAGVFVEVEGEAAVLDLFEQRLAAEAPRLAVVVSIDSAVVPATGETGFRIVASNASDGGRTALPPDVAVCPACLAEVMDPAARRYRYPFANCTDCGPRLTVIRDLPYDRPATTMAGFAMCAACAAEYADPGDRRYHAQPIACPACGPQVRALTRTGAVAAEGTDASIALFHQWIADGLVVAVKGLGGYHLACDATNDAAVALLRERKGRIEKPFAVMLPTLDAARGVAAVDDVDAEALQSAAAPIVLLGRSHEVSLSALVAPGNPLAGVMLPYTPLHHLLFQPVPGRPGAPPRALVLTSGNLTDEPICHDDGEALTRLAGLADGFLVHDRPIHVQCDDSVVRVVDGVVQPVRRSRGYAPLPVRLPVEVAPVLAVGGELKNTFCLAAGRQAWVSQHVGDMENLATLAAFERGVEGFERMYGVSPSVVAADGHPAYLTRRWALERDGVEVIEVQHHHAHVAAVMTEHGVGAGEAVLGVAFDGTGYGVGADGRPELWGGELLLARYDGFRRVGHLRPLPLPGGDAAVRNPCRIAVAYLHALGIAGAEELPPFLACEPAELAVVRRQVESGSGCVPTTSMGRLFDAVASALGVRHRISYEAQAAMELEALAAAGRAGAVALPFALGDDGVLDPAPLLRAVVDGAGLGVPAADLAMAFHQAVANAVGDMVAGAVAVHGDRPVALTGGVFQNALLTRLVHQRLSADGRRVLQHRVVPANDGGLSLGQAVVAGFARRGGG